MIIAGFPGIGKTYFKQHFGNGHFNIYDSDSSKFSWLEDGTRNPNFINDYFKHIEKIKEADPDSFILTSTHADVLKELKLRGHNFIIIVPSQDQLELYIERYKSRGNDDGFIELLKSNWNTWLDDIQSKYPEEIRELESGEHLTELAMRVYETGM